MTEQEIPNATEQSGETPKETSAAPEEIRSEVDGVLDEFFSAGDPEDEAPGEPVLVEATLEEPAPEDAEEPSPEAEPAGDLAVVSEQRAVEPFVPTDYFQEPQRKKGKKRRRRRSKANKIALGVLLALLIVLIAVGGAYAYTLWKNPASFFPGKPTASAAPTDTPEQHAIQPGDATATPGPEETPEPTPTPTIDPVTALTEQADLTLMKNIQTIAVIGVDYAEERETWGGKHDYHADVIMLIAVNFEENRVDLISIPRDTYAKIPNVKGIYKINASLNCGGGMDAPNGEGFLKVCETASWMLGGIPVDYYYAVTMPAVKGLVNAFGGVDYDLELNFTMAGRSYKKGMQHMDGQAVLDYLRVRKNVAASGDQNRINRQKKMMVALFRQMQQENLILKIPEILGAFNGQLYTNCTTAQTAALALFAYNLSSENIGMHSMGGTMKEGIFGWNFVITNQTNRVKIIKQVYDVDASSKREYTLDYATYRWNAMLADQYLKTAKNLTKYVQALIAADDLLPTASPSPSPSLSPSLEPSATPTDGTATATPAAGTATPTPVTETATPTPAADTPTPPPAADTPTAPPADPATTASETTTGTANKGSGTTVVRLSSVPRVVLGEQTQQYDATKRLSWQTYLTALNDLEKALDNADAQAKKYANGKSNSLDSATDTLIQELSHFKNAALQLATDFGYKTSKLNWSCAYWNDKSFNEVDVDFR